ncbi:unnamed protein product [Gongylonema pulchrum]|uniref:protein-L-isoaspartate(D-aspartate) O-methyltransferase n=1 Tax=Gongylonema pulchrum TaxID=637853 RepID=A0A183E1P7_9BILA|nr:unnamed protein product [Gongylonema pulchrum]
MCSVCARSLPIMPLLLFARLLLLPAVLLLLLLSSDAAGERGCGRNSVNGYCTEQTHIPSIDPERQFASPASQQNGKNEAVVQDRENSEGEQQTESEKMTIFDGAKRLLARTAKSAMAWMSSADSNLGLVNNLQNNGLFRDSRVRDAMLSVDRGDFTAVTPYADRPVGIGYGATISAPHMHASSLELLKDHLTEGKKALDVGSGSGYLTACMAIMVGKTGKVVGVEHIQGLVDDSKENIKKHHADLLTSKRVVIVKGDGLDDSKENIKKHHAELLTSKRVVIVKGDGRKGYREESPYDAIHVGAAAATIPTELIDQLAKGGRMLIPVGAEGQTQRFVQVDKDADGKVTRKDLMGVIYVPLTDEERQLHN